MGSIPQYNPSQTSNNTYLPFAVQYATSDAMDQNDIAIKDKRYADRFIYRKESDYPLDTTYTLPLAGIKFNSVNNSTLDYIVNWESSSGQSNRFQASSARSAVGITLNALHTALLRYSISNNLTISTFLQVNSFFLFISHLFQKGLPYRQIKLNFDLSGYMSSVLLPFAFSFLLPVYVYAIAYEKQEKLREMMKMVNFTTQKFLTYFTERP